MNCVQHNSFLTNPNPVLEAFSSGEKKNRSRRYVFGVDCFGGGAGGTGSRRESSNPNLKRGLVVDSSSNSKPDLRSIQPPQPRVRSPINPEDAERPLGMSASPVKRRESPWGLPEGETREPKAHRCNDRAEDIIHACFEGNPFKTVPGPFKLFYRCMRSKPGEEPTEPFYYLELDPPKREVKPE